MNEENANKPWKMIQDSVDYLQGQLPNHPNYTKSRKLCAYVALCVKHKLNNNYKDIKDEKFIEALDYIKFLKKILVKLFDCIKPNSSCI